MDKFGVFNLLNSFINLMGNKNSAESSEENKKDKSFLDNNNANLASVLNKVLSPSQPKSAPASSPPLQVNMLSTMNNHDEIVKRVMKNNGKN